MEKSISDKIKKILEEAKHFHLNNNFIEATKRYEEILIIDAKNFETLFFLSIIKAQTKKFEEAKSLINRAIEIKPEMPDLYNNLGLVLWEMKDLNKSLDSFKKAIKLNAKFAVAYNNLGLVYRDLDDLKNAEESFLKSIEIDPNNSDPFNNLGLIYNNANDTIKAEEFFNKSLNINPKNLQTINNLGNLYKNVGEIEKAEIFFNKAIDINPKFFDTYNNLMVLYERTNSNQKLKELIDRSKKKFPSIEIVNLFEGQYLFKIKNFTESINILSKFSFSQNRLNHEKLRCLIIAKSYDKLNQPKEAFEFFNKNNQIELSQKKNNIDKAYALKTISKRMNFFISENINQSEFEIDKNINKADQPVFLIGFPRSGTTLLDTILRSHQSIEVIEEKPLISNLISSLDKLTKNDLKNLRFIKEDQIQVLRNQYFEDISKYLNKSKSSKIIIDKMPLNIIYVGEIIKIFPNAKFILALRHPYDSVLSCFMQNFELNNSMANFLDIESAAKFYDNVMKLWFQYTKIFSLDLNIVKYENIVNNFDLVVKDTLKFLNLSWSDDVKKFYKTANNRKLISTPSYDQVNKPIYTDSLNRWVKYKTEIKSIIPILEPWLKKFDY